MSLSQLEDITVRSSRLISNKIMGVSFSSPSSPAVDSRLLAIAREAHEIADYGMQCVRMLRVQNISLEDKIGRVS